MNKLLRIFIHYGKGFSTRLAQVLPRKQALEPPEAVKEWDFKSEKCQVWDVAYTEYSPVTGNPTRVEVLVRDPDVVDCPRCGGEGGWGDFDEGEVCSLCGGRGCIDLNLTMPDEMDNDELLTISVDLRQMRDLYGPATRTPAGMVYELANSVPSQERKAVIQRAWEHASKGEVQKAIDLLDSGYFADSYKEELLLTTSAWEENE